MTGDRRDEDTRELTAQETDEAHTDVEDAILEEADGGVASIEAGSTADDAAAAEAGTEESPQSVDAADAGSTAGDEDSLLGPIIAAHPGAEREPGHPGLHDAVRVPPDQLVSFMTAVRDAGYRQFADLCAVDHLSRRPRFDVVVTVVSHRHRRRLVVRCGVPGETPEAPSLTGVYPGANFYEREAFDLFGIEFIGHPDLTRILMPDDWEGFPLRKDYGVGSVPVQFKGAHRAT